MRLFPHRQRGHTAPPLPPPAGPVQCSAVASPAGQRCKLPADATGYCGVFHHATPTGPRPA